MKIVAEGKLRLHCKSYCVFQLPGAVEASWLWITIWGDLKSEHYCYGTFLLPRFSCVRVIINISFSSHPRHDPLSCWRSWRCRRWRLSFGGQQHHLSEGVSVPKPVNEVQWFPSVRGYCWRARSNIHGWVHWRAYYVHGCAQCPGSLLVHLKSREWHKNSRSSTAITISNSLEEGNLEAHGGRAHHWRHFPVWFTLHPTKLFSNKQ